MVVVVDSSTRAWHIAIACLLVVTLSAVMVLAVYVHSQRAFELQPDRSLDRRGQAVVEPDEPAPVDDVEIVLLEDDAGASEAEPLPKPRKNRVAPRATSKPSLAAKPAPTVEPFVYRTYNCIVGPDEPNAGTRTNQRGQCSASDRRAFRLPPGNASSPR